MRLLCSRLDERGVLAKSFLGGWTELGLGFLVFGDVDTTYVMLFGPCGESFVGIPFLFHSTYTPQEPKEAVREPLQSSLVCLKPYPTRRMGVSIIQSATLFPVVSWSLFVVIVRYFVAWCAPLRCIYAGRPRNGSKKRATKRDVYRHWFSGASVTFLRLSR